jgi:hypothetical protein
VSEYCGIGLMASHHAIVTFTVAPNNRNASNFGSHRLIGL